MARNKPGHRIARDRTGHGPRQLPPRPVRAPARPTKLITSKKIATPRRPAAPGAGSPRVSRLEKRSWASWPKVDMWHFLAGFLAFVARLLGACNATPWGPWRGARRTAGLCAAAQHPVAGASPPPAQPAPPAPGHRAEEPRLRYTG